MRLGTSWGGPGGRQVRLMDYGSAAGWEALSPPAPTDAPYRQADPGQSGESPVATRPSATVTADPNPVLTQSQNAGLNAILGLADHASVAIPEPGSRRRYVATTPAMPVRRAAVDVASFAPAPASSRYCSGRPRTPDGTIRSARRRR